MKKIYVVGIGPGDEKMMTRQALLALDEADVIVGYTLYLELLPECYKNKKLISTPMKKEEERCRICFKEAETGKSVAMVCSGDAGVYGMAPLMLDIGREFPGVEIEIIAGVTAACSAAAVLGSPLSNDFCVISLSDLLTPWELIEKRLANAASGDFAIAIYNPSSKNRPEHLRRACDVLLKYIEPKRACGYVENAGRAGLKYGTCSLLELRDMKVNMFTTVFIGNSTTEIYGGRLVTKRGYPAELRKNL